MNILYWGLLLMAITVGAILFSEFSGDWKKKGD